MTPPPPELLIAARTVIASRTTVLCDGMILIRGDRIHSIGARRDLDSDRVPCIDLGDAVVTPGLVNAHTHLALTGLRDLNPVTPDFPVWLDRMATEVPKLSSATLAKAYEVGVRESLGYGTTAVGDIVPPSALLASRESPLAGIRYLELIGFDRTFASNVHLQLGPGEGLAPHAPYSTSESIYRGAAASGLPLSIHVAESHAEVRFLSTGEGPLRSLLESRGKCPEAWMPPGLSPVAYLDQFDIFRAGTLAIHATFAKRRDLSRLHRSGATVVVCPRSNRSLCGRTLKLAPLLARGQRLAIGTDSLASAPSLSVLEELRTLRALQPELEPADLFDLATRGGAEGLGISAGVLTPGYRADLAAFAVEVSDEDPFAALIERGNRARLVVLGGRVLFEEPAIQGL